MPQFSGAQKERANVPRIASNVLAAKEWRKAQAMWRSAAGDLACAQADPTIEDSELNGFRSAEVDKRGKAESALLNYMAFLGGTGSDDLDNIRVESLSKRIRDDEAIVSYTLHESELIIWVLRRSGLTLRVIDASDIRREYRIILRRSV